MTAPLLIFGWGNPSRGDDALGPLFIEHFQTLADRHPEWGEVELLTDFQLQVEHALDLQGRQRVLFVDASMATPIPCTLEAIQPGRDASFTTHAMSPQAVMQVYAEIEDTEPPPCWLLSIRAEQFELGTGLSEAATSHLHAALLLAVAWVETATRDSNTAAIIAK
jgi:hydrogenase maturation protease